MYRRYVLIKKGGVNTKALQYSQCHRVERVEGDREDVSSCGDLWWLAKFTRWFEMSKSLIKWFFVHTIVADMTRLQTS